MNHAYTTERERAQNTARAGWLYCDYKPKASFRKSALLAFAAAASLAGAAYLLRKGR